MKRAARKDLYRLLGGLLEQCPTEELCGELAKSGALEALGASVGGKVGAGLAAMHEDVARGPESHSAIARDFVRLFVGPRKKIAPPWESVYRSPERLVMQACEREVVQIYASEGVGFDGIGKKPADHVALELQFCALLIERSETCVSARATAKRFLEEHVLEWVPRFATDVSKGAQTEFFRGVAAVLLALCASEKTRRASAAGSTAS